VVYDPDQALVCDIVACEDAHESERVGVQPLIESAQAGQVWIADRHFCTRTILAGLSNARAGFVVHEHTGHPRLAGQGHWGQAVRIDTGLVREQTIDVDVEGQLTTWRRIEIELDTPTEAGEAVIRLWSNMPTTIEAVTIAALYRKRWRIEGMFQRFESVLHSEISSLGHPRAALLGFAVAVLAYNVVALLQRAVEKAHRQAHPQLEVSSYHLAQHVKTGYEGLLIALPSEHWPSIKDDLPQTLAQRLLRLARRVLPRQVATSKRGPKIDKPKGYVDGATARSHVSTARVLAKARANRP
jgi:IS4 transposase